LTGDTRRSLIEAGGFFGILTGESPFRVNLVVLAVR
jgi:hypothetical protein